MSQQSLRHASFRAIGGTAGTYNDDARAAFEAEATIHATATYNEAFILWLQERLGSSTADLPGLMQEFADAAGATNWGTVGAFNPESFTPLDFSGIVTWLATLEASDTTLDVSDDVSSWNDRETGTTPSDFTQVTASLRPIRSTDAKIVFDGTDDTLSSGVDFNTAFSGNVWGVFCVVKILGNSTATENPWQNNAVIRDAGAFFGLHIKNTTAPFDLIGYAWDTSAHVATVPGNEQDTWLVVQFWHDGSNIKLQVNGGTVATAPCGAVNASAGAIEISSFGDMELRDVVLIDGTPSFADLAQYLAWARVAYSLS